MAFRVETVQEYFDRLGERFVAAGAKGVNAVYQFELAGDGGGTWHAVVADGTMELNTGAHDAPTTTIRMKADDYVKMTNGDLNGQMAYMTGKMKIAGSIPMAMKMKAIFPSN